MEGIEGIENLKPESDDSVPDSGLPVEGDSDVSESGPGEVTDKPEDDDPLNNVGEEVTNE